MSGNRVTYRGYIIVDIDGTLAQIDRRLDHLIEKPKRWDEFYKKIPSDVPNKWCVELVKRMHNLGILLCTGRPKKTMPDTRDWLKKHDIPYLRIFCREDGDLRPDYIVKKEIFEEQIRDFYRPILFIVEDRDRVVQMWRQLGFTCLQCADGKY